MTFWIRHLTLVVLCVVVPLIGALYVDTHSEISRAQEAGATTARLAERSLGQSLQLDAHQAVGETMTLARKVTDADLLDEIGKGGQRRDRAIESLNKLLQDKKSAGFVWLIDAAGQIVFVNGMSQPIESPRSIVGHPMFRRTQEGFAIDGFWGERGKLSMVGAAPITKDGRAEGALMIGQTVGKEMLVRLASSLGGELTVVSGSNVVATTLDPSFAAVVAKETAGAVDPVSGGRLEKPLASGVLPFLPMLVDAHADGFAYSSYGRAAPSGSIRWIVSMPSAGALQELASRQEILLAVLLASLMLALLVGLLNHRTFVSPIERVAEHLSAIQLGRGETELPEAKVSSPFRRLVRLINMMVQKMPTRAFPPSASLAETSPISELPGSITGDLVPPPAPTPRKPEPPRAAKPAVPLAEPEELSLPPVELSAFPAPASTRPAAAPAKKAPPPMVFTGHDEEEDAVADAIATMNLSKRQEESDGYDDNEDSAAAIAEAIASLEAQQSASTDSGLSSPGVRSAASIRGGTPQIESPFMPSQSEYFRAGTNTAPKPTPQQKFYMPPEEKPDREARVRGGGSLTIDAPTSRGLGSAALADPGSFGPEETVVAPVQEDLLARSARDITGQHQAMDEDGKPDATVVASVPADLLAQSAGEAMPEGPAGGDHHGLDAADHAHFKQVYERFIDMRKKCGEPTADLAFDRFLTKLTKNRENLIKKYNCRTVRFQVYEKDGKAALKATPVRAR